MHSFNFRGKGDKKSLIPHESYKQIEDLKWANEYQLNFPPSDISITLTQINQIKTLGVKAWALEPRFEEIPAIINNQYIFINNGHDDQFSVQSNLPLPISRDIIYFEVKIQKLTSNSLISIGIATKPYPPTSLPGWHKHSIGFFSSGHRGYNRPEIQHPFGKPYKEGDYIGVKYYPKTHKVLFVCNDYVLGNEITLDQSVKFINFFPTIGARGPCELVINFGQERFQYEDANRLRFGVCPPKAYKGVFKDIRVYNTDII